LSGRGGDPVRLTDFRADVEDAVWSPDGKRLALVVSDVDPDDPDNQAEGAGKDEPKTPKPIVIKRRQFLRDGQGYLRDLRSHVYVFDVESKHSEQVTTGPYDDSGPTWSPAGRWRALPSTRTADPDANQNTDIFVVAARAGQTPLPLTRSPGADQSPVWSPDGRSVAYVAGGRPEDIWY